MLSSLRKAAAQPQESRPRKETTSLPLPIVVRKREVSAAPRELWIGMHFPQLAIEALAISSGAGPFALVEVTGQTHYVAAANETALRAGVHAGMSMASALALLPGLTTRPRSPQCEQQLL